MRTVAKKCIAVAIVSIVLFLGVMFAPSPWNVVCGLGILLLAAFFSMFHHRRVPRDEEPIEEENAQSQ
jgi:4-hydroxybenzoate polyprenyltransferase